MKLFAYICNRLKLNNITKQNITKMKTKFFTLLLNKSLLSKLALIALLLTGGGNCVWGDTVIFDATEGSVHDGWTYSASLSSTQNYNLFHSWGTKTYTSNGNIVIASGQKIIISAKTYGSSSPHQVTVNYSSDNGTNYSSGAIVNVSEASDYTDFEVSEIVGTYKIQFVLSYCYIQRIILKDPEVITTPILSITHPGTGDAFGYVTENVTKTYTIENVGTGSMDVNIASSDEAFFKISTSSLIGITNDGVGKTFDVTFNYDSSNPQPRSANITITPTFEGAVADVISVSAGPDVELNEDKIPDYLTGTGKNVYVKYIASSGWNTICMPIGISGSMNTLFGSDYKAYTLSGYENNTLTFKKDQYLATTANPYLVYVPTATSPANGFVIENIMVYNLAAKATNPAGTTACFQGTYAPKEYQDGDDWYGVTTAGQVMKAGTGAKVKGYRAYFTGISAPAAGAHISIAIDDDGGTTDLGFVKLIDENANDVYTLSGQKVKKGGKGIYIVNGRKVIIK